MLGYLDDLVIVPAGIVLLLKMIPKEVMEESRQKARSLSGPKKPKNWIAGLIIVLLWMVAIYVMVRTIW